MPIIALSGFEAGNANFSGDERYDGGGTVSVQTTTRASGEWGLQLNSGGFYAIARRNSAGRHVEVETASTWHYCRFRCAGLPSGGTFEIYAFRPFGTKAIIRVNADGSIAFLDTAGSVVQTTAAGVVSANTWHELEWRLTTGSPTSAYEVRLDGVTVLSGVADQSTGGWMRTSFFSNSNSNLVHVDDYVARDDTWVGTGLRIVRLDPTANGAHAQWTGGDFTNVNENPRGSGALASSILNDRHSFTLDSLTAAGAGTPSEIIAVASYGFVSGTVAAYLRSASTESAGSDAVIGSTAESLLVIRETDPATGAAWTNAGVNAVQAGIRCRDSVSASLAVIGAMVLYRPATVDTAAAWWWRNIRGGGA